MLAWKLHYLADFIISILFKNQFFSVMFQAAEIDTVLKTLNITPAAYASKTFNLAEFSSSLALLHEKAHKTLFQSQKMLV